MCPDCGSLRLTVQAYDEGICPETGYHDCGELFRCHYCGARGPIEDVIAQPERARRIPARRPIQRCTGRLDGPRKTMDGRTA